MGCTQCITDSICTQCNSITYFLKTGDTKCTLCSASTTLTNCYICDFSGASCQICMPNFMLLGITSQCSACGLAIDNCSSCNTTTCLGCESGFFLIAGGCASCTTIDLHCNTCIIGFCNSCVVGYYLSVTCNLCSDAIPNCTACANPNACTACTNNTVVAWNGTAIVCRTCGQVMWQCLTCLNINVCLTCNYTTGYYLNPVAHLCDFCQFAIPFCDKCQSSTLCDSCISNQYAISFTFQC